MLAVAKDKKVGSYAKKQNKISDFNTLIYQEESINKCGTCVESEWGSDFSTDITDYKSLDTDFFA